MHACILHIIFFILLITFLSSADFFLKKNLPGYYLQCETVLIQIQPHILLGLIWVQLVCIWITIDYKICPGWQWVKDKINLMYIVCIPEPKAPGWAYSILMTPGGGGGGYLFPWNKLACSPKIESLFSYVPCSPILSLFPRSPQNLAFVPLK